MNLISGLRDTFTAEEVAMAPASRILICLNEWRRGEEVDGTMVSHIESSANICYMEEFRMSLEKPYGRTKVAEKIRAPNTAAGDVRAIVEGAAKMWRTRCKLASGASVAGLAIESEAEC